MLKLTILGRALAVTVLLLAISTAGAAQRWLLVYAGRGRHYGGQEFSSLLYGAAGAKTVRLFDGIICLDVASPAGRSFTSWSQSGPPHPDDYTSYLDSLFSSSSALTAADSVVAARGETLAVAVMVPYPLGGVTRSPPWDHRINFLNAYLQRAETLFSARRYRALRLWGFYWLSEEVSPNDTLIVQRFTSMVHWNGLRAMWIPYFVAQSASRWRGLGFDEAYLQPNYFFNRDLSPERLDSAISRSLTLGMGLEIEFDRRLLTDSGYAARLQPYLSALESVAGRRIRAVAVYDGGGTMVSLSREPAPSWRRVYDSLVGLLLERAR